MPIETTLTNAFDASNAGEHWRSREILRSSLSNYGYDLRLLSALADTCVAMGDRMEAGRWLLSFIDDPDDSQQASIDLFVNRHRSGGYRSLLSQLPAAVRPTTLDDSPKCLRRILHELDAPTTLQPTITANPNSATPWIALGSCGLAFALSLICALVGLVVIADWLLDRLGPWG